MHGSMTGYHEARRDFSWPGGSRRHVRLFCYLDHVAPGLQSPLIVIIDGRTKPLRQVLPEAEYSAVRKLALAYRSSAPRRVASPRFTPGSLIPAAAVYRCAGIQGKRCPHQIEVKGGAQAPPMPAGCPARGWRRIPA